MKKAVPAREVSGFRLRLRTLFPFCWRDLGVCIVILVLATLLCHFLRLFDKSDVFVEDRGNDDGRLFIRKTCLDGTKVTLEEKQLIGW